MPIKYAINTAIAAAAAIVALPDGGAAAGKIRVYNGAQPTNPNTAVGAQVLLVEFALPDPSYGAPVDTTPGAVATGNAIAPATAVADGTATWYRVLDSNNNAIWDGDAGDLASSASLKLSNTSITTGVEITVVSSTFTQPKA